MNTGNDQKTGKILILDKRAAFVFGHFFFIKIIIKINMNKYLTNITGSSCKNFKSIGLADSEKFSSPSLEAAFREKRV